MKNPKLFKIYEMINQRTGQHLDDMYETEITLLDFFAGCALIGYEINNRKYHYCEEDMAKFSYAHAKAMLEEREKHL
jgi:hypothetical protein